jgi:hypothetical protein
LTIAIAQNQEAEFRLKDSIKDNLNHTIRLEFNAKNQCSQIAEALVSLPYRLTIDATDILISGKADGLIVPSDIVNFER